MSEDQVEVSTRLRPGEWTEESLATLVADYQQDIAAMGALPEHILTHVERLENGAVNVKVAWDKPVGNG